MKNLKLATLLLIAFGLTACGGSDDETTNPNAGGGVTLPDVEFPTDDDADTDTDEGISGSTNSSTMVVKELAMLPASELFPIAVDTKTYGEGNNSKLFSGSDPFATCPDAYVFNRGRHLIRDNGTFQGSRSYFYKSDDRWVGGTKDNAGFWTIKTEKPLDNCLVGGSTMASVGYPEASYERQSTVFINGEVAYLDFISTLAMARIQKEMPMNVSRCMKPVGHTAANVVFEDCSNKHVMPTNEQYSLEEGNLIAEIKASDYYNDAVAEVALFLENNQSSEFYKSFLAFKDRAELNVALHLMKEAAADNGVVFDIENAINVYKDGGTLVSAFGL